MLNPDRGAYYVVDTGTTSGVPKIVVFGSLNNASSFPCFCNLILQQLLRLQVPDELQGDHPITLSLSQWPLKQAVLIDTFLNSSAANILAIFFVSVIVGLESISMVLMANRITSGYYDAIMQRGGTKGTYVLATYVIDVIHYLVAGCLI